MTKLNEVDLSNGIKTFVENKIFNENKNIVGLNASMYYFTINTIITNPALLLLMADGNKLQS
jgi:hypothetical protein